MVRALAALAALATATPRLANAQPNAPPAGASQAAQTPEARAQSLFKRSAESYRQGDFQQAVDLLIEAHMLQPEPVLLYNLGRAYEGLGNRAAARDAYQQYLRDEPGAPDRGGIERRIATLQQELDQITAMEKQRAEQQKRDEDAKRADAAKKQRDAEPPAAHRSPLPFIVGGVGVAGIGTGVVLGVLASSKHDKAVSDTVQKDAADQQSTAHTYADVANVAYVAGGVLVAAGVVLWVVDGRGASGSQKASAQRELRVVLDPRGVSALGTF